MCAVNVGSEKPRTVRLGEHREPLGIEQALVGMRRNGLRFALVPAALGYGANPPPPAAGAAAAIPPNAPLCVQLQVVKIKPKAGAVAPATPNAASAAAAVAPITPAPAAGGGVDSSAAAAAAGVGPVMGSAAAAHAAEAAADGAAGGDGGVSANGTRMCCAQPCIVCGYWLLRCSVCCVCRIEPSVQHFPARSHGGFGRVSHALRPSRPCARRPPASPAARLEHRQHCQHRQYHGRCGGASADGGGCCDGR